MSDMSTMFRCLSVGEVNHFEVLIRGRLSDAIQRNSMGGGCSEGMERKSDKAA